MPSFSSDPVSLSNERLEAEGKADQVEADVKQAGEKIKDIFK
ncbi:CsbD family protein [Tessaracoccus lapidicaptus]